MLDELTHVRKEIRAETWASGSVVGNPYIIDFGITLRIGGYAGKRRTWVRLYSDLMPSHTVGLVHQFNSPLFSERDRPLLLAMRMVYVPTNFGRQLRPTITLGDSPLQSGTYFGCLPEQLLESAHVSKHDAPGGRCYVMANARRSRGSQRNIRKIACPICRRSKLPFLSAMQMQGHLSHFIEILRFSVEPEGTVTQILHENASILQLVTDSCNLVTRPSTFLTLHGKFAANGG